MSFLNPPARTGCWEPDVLASVQAVAASDEYILKSGVAELEAAIAGRIGVAHAVGCASGTGALQLSLMALGIGPGRRVITPAYSFISSASTIVLAGATPVFADVDACSATLDPVAAADRSAGADAVLAVHLFSSLADMDGLAPLAARGLRIIEDSAVSLGASLHGRPAGTLGDIGIFSFFPGKPLGGIGDAGMVVTSDEAVASACRELRNHGQDARTRFLHHRVGLNCRMDEITAMFLVRRLRVFDDVLTRRRRLAELYSVRLAEIAEETGADLGAPPPGSFAARSPHIYAVQVGERDRLQAYLHDRGVQTKVHYPRPLPYQPAFAGLGHAPGDFPVAERLAARMLALPLHENMSPARAGQIADLIGAFCRRVS
jgi:dTDP-4-amino-4,6-dideoxygalactose transaminase